MRVITSNGENYILEEIEEAAENSVFVIIDLEGLASKLVSYAMSQADFVIVPIKEQEQDANPALDIIMEIHRNIPYAVLFTQTRYVKSRTARHIASQFRENDRIDTFETEIHERDAYSSVVSTGGSVRYLDPKNVNNLEKAIANAEAFRNEVIAKLQAFRQGDERQVA